MRATTCTGLLFALAVSIADSATAQDVLSPYAAKNWLAFTVSSGARDMAMARNEFLNATPDVIVFRDGRVIWRSGGYGEQEQGEWRTGSLSKSALDKFAARARASNAIENRQEISKSYVLSSLDTKAETVGVSLAGSDVIFHPWITHGTRMLVKGTKDPADTSVEAVSALAKLIRSLRHKVSPNEGTRYIADEILVYFEVWGRGALVGKIRKWPVQNDSIPLKTFTRRYSGARARTILAALKSGNVFTDGKNEAMVWWRPALDAPVTEQDYDHEPFTAKKWDVAREGAFRTDGKGQNGFLYRWNLVKDLLRNHVHAGQAAAELTALLGRPDSAYKGSKLRDFGDAVKSGEVRASDWDISGLHNEAAGMLYLVLFFDRADRLTRAITMVH